MLHHYRLIVTVVAAFSSCVRADTIYVDDDNCPGPGSGMELDPYCSIQTAIDAAVDTDDVVVAPGTYFETISFLGKAIWLHSSDGPEVTVIDGTGFFHVVQCVSGEGPNTILDGFTITGGNADGAMSEDRVGGGMLNVSSSPTVTNCTFIGNTATDSGGGMFNNNSSPTLTDCTFSGNSANSIGAGMFNVNSSPTVTNCTFIGNTATDSGGGMLNLGGSPTVTKCSFIGNSANTFGGGGMFNNFGSPTVNNCTFNGNTAGNSGGGMQNISSSPTVTNCTFSGNMADSSGGGMVYFGVSNPTVTNCTFALNSAANGNALGFDFGPSELVMTNCILWDGGDEIGNNNGSALTITYTDVQGGFPGTGNIDADPLFVDPDNGNLRLAPGSPCIDAANNIAVPAGITTDLDGNPRFVDDPDTPDCQQAPGQCGDPPVVDMGAYEFQGGLPCPWDCGDNDSNVGIVDFLALLAEWDEVGTPCDFDGGGVGIVDFLKLLANWGPCP